MAVVIGAGPSGLRMCAHLKRKNVRHIVLDRRAIDCLRKKSWPYERTHPLSYALATPEASGDLPPLVGSLRGTPLSEWDERALRTRNPLSADHSDLIDGADASFGFGCQNTGLVHLLPWTPSCEPLPLIDSTRVVDVRRREVDYVIQCRCEEFEKFVNRSYVASIVFICVSPTRAARWSILQQWARAQLHAVFPLPTGRLVYDASTASTINRGASSLAGRVVVDESGRALSTTTGRVARFWNRIRRTAPAVFHRLVLEEVDDGAQQPTFSFSDHGSHAWRPAPAFDLHRIARRALTPNPRHLPNVYWCHNAYSAHPGRLEGDLRAADAAIDLVLQKQSARKDRRAPRRDEVVVEGRILRADDLAPWMDETDVPLHKRGGDITDDFYHHCDTPDAWAAVFSLQTAFEL